MIIIMLEEDFTLNHLMEGVPLEQKQIHLDTEDVHQKETYFQTLDSVEMIKGTIPNAKSTVVQTL